MAFVPRLLRRAAASSSTIRAFGSRRTFQSAVSTILSSEKRGITRDGGFAPLFLRFSTTAVAKPAVDENLVRAVESEIDAAGPPKFVKQVEGVLDGFPFDIVQDNHEEIILERRFGSENVKIIINLAEITDIGEANIPSSIPLKVAIIKGSRPNMQGLGFNITAFPREFTIDCFVVFGDEVSFVGQDFSDVDSKTQKAFHKYVEARGMELSTINFLFQYVANKGERDRFNCLNRVKKFVEED